MRQGSRRLAAIDWVRGSFIIVITLAHVATNLDRSALSSIIDRAFTILFGSGTVGFMLTSGFLLGYFIAVRPNLDKVFARYRKQAFRLLFIVHPLLSLMLYLPLRDAHGGTDPGLFRFFAMRFYVTDVFATLFLLAPLVRVIPPRWRLLIGALLLVVRREWECADWSSSPGRALAREIFAGMGMHRRVVLLDGYPWLALAGAFLIASWAGDLMGAMERTDARSRFLSTLWKISAVAALLGAVQVSAWYVSKSSGATLQGTARCMCYPDPFGGLFPAYLAATFALFAYAIGRYVKPRPPTPAARAAILLGRTSLFSYVFQYVPAQMLPYLLGLRFRMSPAIFAVWGLATLALTVGAARLWNRYVQDF